MPEIRGEAKFWGVDGFVPRNPPPPHQNFVATPLLAARFQAIAIMRYARGRRPGFYLGYSQFRPSLAGKLFRIFAADFIQLGDFLGIWVDCRTLLKPIWVTDALKVFEFKSVGDALLEEFPYQGRNSSWTFWSNSTKWTERSPCPIFGEYGIELNWSFIRKNELSGSWS